MARKSTRRPARRPRRKIARRKAHKINSLMASAVRPDRLLVKLPYADYYTKTLTFGTPGQTQAWNLNSIYDPDRTGTGHQPLGTDQWATFYKKYRVFKVAYNISISNMSADSSVMGGITPTNGVFGNFNDMSVFEQPHCRKFHIGNREGISTRTLKGAITLPYITGRPLVSYKSDNVYAAQFGQNPLEVIALNLQLFSLNPTAGASLQISCRLVYFVELYDPLTMPLSSTNPLPPNQEIPVSLGDEQNE